MSAIHADTFYRELAARHDEKLYYVDKRHDDMMTVLGSLNTKMDSVVGDVVKMKADQRWYGLLIGGLAAMGGSYLRHLLHW